jgi:hypothetical protein
MNCDDWVIVILEPPTDPEQFPANAALIRGFLNNNGYHVRQITRSGMGAALVQFSDGVSRDTAIDRSPFFVGDSVLRVIPQNRGLNYRNCTFTHDVWIMMMNFPLEAWHVEKIHESVSEFGRFLVWNRDGSNRARVLVKIRVPDILEIPTSHVLCENTDDASHGQSWTIVNYILQANLIGGMGGDDDLLPPDDANPHPMPNLPFGGIWEDAEFHQNNVHENIIHHAAPADNAGHGNAAPAADGEPILHTPPQSPQEPHQNNLNLQPAIEATDAFIAMHNMIGDIITNLPDIVETLQDDQISGACFKLVTVDGPEGQEKKGIITVFTESPPLPFTNSCTITDLPEDFDCEHVTILDSTLTPDEHFDDFHLDPMDDHAASDAAMSDGGSTVSTYLLSPAPAGKKQKQ